jgi:hypothetical protein
MSITLRSGLGYLRVRDRCVLVDFLGGVFDARVADLMGRTVVVDGAAGSAVCPLERWLR